MQSSLSKPYSAMSSRSSSVRCGSSRLAIAMGWPVRTASAVAGKRSMSRTWPTTLASRPSRSALTRQRSVSSCSVKMSQSAAPMVSRSRSASAVSTVSRSWACEATAPSSTMSRRTVVRRSSWSTRRAFSNAPASVCAVLRRKLRYSAKSRSRVS